jgi:mRNA-degrading endonuclease RelE of RelBE toxin-antitoxin system
VKSLPSCTITLEFTFSFLEAYRRLPQSIQRKVDYRINLLAQNIGHPGLRARKVTGVTGIYEARVDRRYRLLYERLPGVLHFRSLGTHQIYQHL